MSIKLRLSRGGRKKLPFYSIVATNSTSPRDGKFLEKVGTFNPTLAKDNEQRLVVKIDRAEYWISVGALPSERVAKLLVELGVKSAEKYIPKFTPKKKYDGAKKKTLERLQAQKEAAEEKAAKAKEEAEAAAAAQEEKKKAEEEAKAAEAANAPQAEEAPAQETPAAEAPAEEVKAEEAPKAEENKEEAKN